MALGILPYKTPNPINLLTVDLSDYEGHGLRLSAQNEVSLAAAKTDIPYGVVVVGAKGCRLAYRRGPLPSHRFGGRQERAQR
jgi:hypothetical protein